MTQARMAALLQRYSPKLRNRFRQIVQKTKDKWTVAQLEAALEGGTLGAVIDDVEKAAASIASGTAAVHTAVATEVATVLSDRLGQLVSYDGTNPRAVDALRMHRLQWVQGLASETRENFTTILAEAQTRGLNPRKTAVALRDSLGLTPTQEQWVRNYRRKLETLDAGALDNKLRDARSDAAVQRAIDSGTRLPQAQIDRMVARYTDRAIKYRAEVIARTEALRGTHMGMEEGYRQAIESGHLDAARLQAKWHAGAAPRTRDWHASMNGQLQPFGVPFVSGHGSQLRHPGDPDAPASEVAQCRCAKSVRVLPEGQVAVSSTGAPGALAAPSDDAMAPVTLPPAKRSKYADAAVRDRAVAKNLADIATGEPRKGWTWRLANRPDDTYSAAVAPGMTHSRRSFATYRREFASTLTDAQTDAALFYSYRGDRLLNAGLREGWFGESPELARIAGTLDEVIAAHRVPRDTHVQRGLKGSWGKQMARRLVPGDTFSDPGYSSASATQPFAGPVRFDVRIPAGARAAPIPSQFGNEDEMLLPRGTTYRVTSWKDMGAGQEPRYVVGLEVVDG